MVFLILLKQPAKYMWVLQRQCKRPGGHFFKKYCFFLRNFFSFQMVSYRISTPENFRAHQELQNEYNLLDIIDR
jgi:hypothetical protein